MPSGSTPILTGDDLPARDAGVCLALFSSWFGGIVLDPSLMVVPVDDHLVHRGDGVFETVKEVNGRLWLLEAHLERLATSAATIGIELPWSKAEITTILRDTVAAADLNAPALLRVLVSRGPGGFSVNPYESTAPQLYVAVYPAKPPFMERNPNGASIKLSTVPVKPGLLARVKTCNYIPNALMKKEAVDAGVDFVIGVDEKGRIAESFTENLCLVRDGVLIRPPAERILAGTTMMRVFELAEAADIPTEVRAFTPKELTEADELLIMGTTSEITVVTRFEDRTLVPGPLFKRLAKLLHADLYV